MGPVRWLVTPVVLAAVLTGLGGCTPDSSDGSSASERSESASALPSATSVPSSPPSPLRRTFLAPLEERLQAAVAQEARAGAQRAKIAAFLKKAKRVRGGHVGTEFTLEEVQYTSPTDAAASFRYCGTRMPLVCTNAIATTHDNWAHAAGLAIPDNLADIVEYLPLGHGAVAIKAVEQLVGHTSYPPIVLHPDGRVALLNKTPPQPLETGSTLVNAYQNGDFANDVGLLRGLFAADTAAGEAFAVSGAPGGYLWDNVPGRHGAVLTVAGYRKNVGAGVWRFHESTDDTHTWRQVDVRLPLGGKALWDYADDYRDAVGPGHRMAIAMADEPEDMPLGLRELWRTDDEKTFRRVRLSWKGPDGGPDLGAFSGIAFAADGALLLAGLVGPATICEKIICNHRWTMWRLSPHGADLRPLPGAPRMVGDFYPDLLSNAGAGVIVARTGNRTIEVSPDGYAWTKVTPGR